MGLLASLGVDPVEVVRRPKVSVLSTGNELVEPDETPGPGQIRDANRFSLIAALQEAGAEVVWAGRGPDDAAALRSSLINRLARVTSSSRVAASRWVISISQAAAFRARPGPFPPRVHEAGEAVQLCDLGRHPDIQSARQPGIRPGRFRGLHPTCPADMLGASEIDRPRARCARSQRAAIRPHRVSAGCHSRRFRGSSEGIDYRTAGVVAIGVTRWRQRLDRSSAWRRSHLRGIALEAILVGPLATGAD